MDNSLPTSQAVQDSPPARAPSEESKETKQRKRKTVRIELVVDEDEAKIIDDNAKQMCLNRSEYLRARGLKRVYTKNRQVPPSDIIALIKILSELKRQGNNLNQIARRLNSGGSFDRAIHLKATEKLLSLLKNWHR